MREFPYRLPRTDLYHGAELSGAARIARLTGLHIFPIWLKSDIPLKRVTPILADGSYLAEISGYGVSVIVAHRVLGHCEG